MHECMPPWLFWGTPLWNSELKSADDVLPSTTFCCSLQDRCCSLEQKQKHLVTIWCWNLKSDIGIWHHGCMKRINEALSLSQQTFFNHHWGTCFSWCYTDGARVDAGDRDLKMFGFYSTGCRSKSLINSASGSTHDWCWNYICVDVLSMESRYPIMPAMS